MYYVLFCILFVSFIQINNSYIVELTHHDPPGLVVFNTNVLSDKNNSNATRYYYINHDRSATFIRRIIHVDETTGNVILKHHLECNGLKYPNIFTLYIDSVSNATIDYMSVPLRVIIRKCSHHFHPELVNEDYVEGRKWKSHTLVSYTIPTAR